MITDSILSYGCALQRDIFVQGRMYVFWRTTVASVGVNRIHTLSLCNRRLRTYIHANRSRELHASTFGWDSDVRKRQFRAIFPDYIVVHESNPKNGLT